MHKNTSTISVSVGPISAEACDARGIKSRREAISYKHLFSILSTGDDVVLVFSRPPAGRPESAEFQVRVRGTKTTHAYLQDNLHRLVRARHVLDLLIVLVQLLVQRRYVRLEDEALRRVSEAGACLRVFVCVPSARRALASWRSLAPPPATDPA